MTQGREEVIVVKYSNVLQLADEENIICFDCYLRLILEGYMKVRNKFLSKEQIETQI